MKNTMTTLVINAKNDPKLVDLLCEFSEAAHKAAHFYNVYSLRSGDCWINGRPVRTDFSSEETIDRAASKVRKACRIANILRKEYGLRYDRYYDLSKNSENFKLAAALVMELGTAINDATLLDRAEDLIDAAEVA